jgi:hypothetical protein
MARKSARDRNQQTLGARLNKVIRLLEDLFILQAVTFGISRNHVRAILGVRTTRVSRIKKSLRQTKGHVE